MTLSINFESGICVDFPRLPENSHCETRRREINRLENSLCAVNCFYQIKHSLYGVKMSSFEQNEVLCNLFAELPVLLSGRFED